MLSAQKTAAEAKVIIGPLRAGQKGSKLHTKAKIISLPFIHNTVVAVARADAMIPLGGA